MSETHLRIIIDVAVEGTPHEVELMTLEGVAAVAVEREVEAGKLKSLESRREMMIGRVPVFVDHRGTVRAGDPRSRDLRCPCECNSGGSCGGCGHAGCGDRRR